jgi:hypothetical protein
MASKKTSQRPQITSLATGDRIKAIDVSEPDATKDAWFTIATLTAYLQTLLMANPMTTAGDVITGGSGGTPARLGIGANGRVLGVSGGALAYLDLSGVYEAARTLMSQATAEGGSDTAVFSVNALRLRQAANAAIAAWVGAAPGALDTLDELAAALGDDANFAATITSALAGKANTSHTHGTGGLDDGAVTLAKMANLAASRIIGRAVGAGTGVPVALTGSQIREIIGLPATDGLLIERAAGDDNATLVLDDAGKLVSINSGSARTWTIPANADVAFPVGSGVTIRAAGGELVSDGQYATWSAVKTGTNTWLVAGRLTA